MRNTIIIAIIAVLVGGVAGYFLTSSKTMGALVGGKPISVEYNFNAGLTGEKMIKTGDVLTKTATADTLTAEEVCNTGVLISTPGNVDDGDITFPTASLLFGKCLTRNGDSLQIPLINGSAVTSTVIAAGSGGTLEYSESATITAGDGAMLTVFRISDSAYELFVDNVDN